MVSELWMRTACEIADSLESGEISQLDVLESLEMRCRAVNPIINALPTYCFNRARKAIKNDYCDPFAKKNPLFGLPIPIKDSYMVSGVRTTFGSLVFQNFVPEYSDLVTRTLEKSGAVIYAKSNTPEFEAGASTFNEVFGITRNPWNTKRSTAGSSGGAAASVASGMAFIAQGSDFACSIRYPAAFCGIVGLRPTPGLVPQGPSRLPYQNLSVIGPLARNIEDIGLAMDAMVAFDVQDPLTSPKVQAGYRAATLSPKKPSELGFSMELDGLAIVSSEIKDLVGKSIALIQDEGVKINYSCPDVSQADEAFRPLRAAQFAGMWSHVLTAERDLIKPEVVWNIEQGLKLSSSDIYEAELKRNKIRANILEYLDVNEFLILPATPVVANLAEDRFVKKIDSVIMKDYLEWLLLGYIISLTGCPAISIPCGFSIEGLPVAVQVIAKPYQEIRLLRLASWLENVFKCKITIPIDPISK